MQVEVINQNKVLGKAIVATGLILATAFAVVVVTYGLDTVIAGAHDTFHDFRHVIGMACH